MADQVTVDADDLRAVLSAWEGNLSAVSGPHTEHQATDLADMFGIPVQERKPA